MVQPVGLTVELPSTAHGPTPARTWTGRNPGLTLLGAPRDPRRRPETVLCLSALLAHCIILELLKITPFPSSPLVSRCKIGFAPGPASLCLYTYLSLSTYIYIVFFKFTKLNQSRNTARRYIYSLFKIH